MDEDDFKGVPIKKEALQAIIGKVLVDGSTDDVLQDTIYGVSKKGLDVVETFEEPSVGLVPTRDRNGLFAFCLLKDLSCNV